MGPIDCLVSVLCGLSAPVRAALISAIDAMIAALTAQVIALQVLVEAVQNVYLPIPTAAKQVAETALAATQGGLALIPTEALQGCVSAKEWVDAASQALYAAQVEVRQAINQCNQYIAYGDMLNAEIQKLTDMLAQCNSVKSILQLCP